MNAKKTLKALSMIASLGAMIACGGDLGFRADADDGEDADGVTLDVVGGDEVGTCVPDKSEILGAFCTGTSYGGRAKVVQADVASLVHVTLVDTGELPSTGGTKEGTLLDVLVTPGILHGQTASARTTGTASQTKSYAEIQKLNASVLGIGISADVVRSDASGTCTINGPSLAGSSVVANLKVNGLTVNADSTPNQRIAVGNVLEIIINEQTTTNGALTVNALHIRALKAIDLADVVVASARAKITCSCTESPTPDAGTPDANPPTDGGTPSNDSGTPTDSGTPVDSGITTDGGETCFGNDCNPPKPDSGTPIDSGTPVDSGTTTDGGETCFGADCDPPKDSGTPSNDSGAPTDSGITPDSGSPNDSGTSTDSGKDGAGDGGGVGEHCSKVRACSTGLRCVLRHL